jgi:hypothetical protein
LASDIPTVMFASPCKCIKRTARANGYAEVGLAPYTELGMLFSFQTPAVQRGPSLHLHIRPKPKTNTLADIRAADLRKVVPVPHWIDPVRLVTSQKGNCANETDPYNTASCNVVLTRLLYHDSC